MGAQLRVLRRRIKSVNSTKKITKAMELIATSRIQKAQQRVAAAEPYATEITRVLTALATHSDLEHPLLTPRPVVQRAAVVVVTADRGLAGGYNVNALRTAEELITSLRQDNIEPVLYVVGRKGVGYYRFRNRPIEGEWTGFSEQPAYGDAQQIGQTLVPSFFAGADDVVTPDGALEAGPDGVLGVDEIHLVSTQFRSMISQEPVAKRIAPMEVIEVPRGPEALPAYEFEPEPDAMMADLLPRYINTRIYAALLESAASESAARRAAMKAATDNATELVKGLSREANQARQAEITQEISEIVGGADALSANAGSDA